MKRNINFSWPASLSDFKKDEKTETFSRGKLKVFYEGETADHRFFSKDFAEELAKTLPYTPIVSYYDTEKDDFVGHASEQQIFGIVDPCADYTVEKDEDGNSWYVCDVVMYTERPDKVGEWAKKIVGHKQSLELDPTSVKYVINYDEKKHFKNIEFTAGRFIGVSVLGNDQKPAFTGSAFFSYDEEFESKMKILKDYCAKGQEQTSQVGGNTMNLKEFMTLSWGDISVKVGEKIDSEYANDAFTSIVDMFEDSAIVRFYYYMEGACRLMRVKYSMDENGEVTLGDVNEVHITYEDVITPSTNAETDIAQAEQTKTDDDDAGTKPEDENNKKDEENSDCACGEEAKKDDDTSDCACGGKKDDETSNCTEPPKDDEKSKCAEIPVGPQNEPAGPQGDLGVTPAQDANVEIAAKMETTEKASVDNEETNAIQQKDDSGATSFTQSERAELEALKREKKVTLVDSYKDSLNDEEYNNFIANIDSFDEKDLELQLLKAYKANSSKTIKPMRAFAFAPVQENAENTLDSFVKKYKR